MASELRNLMADLELSLVETVDRLEQAEINLLYVDVLAPEQRIEALHEALAFVAESITEQLSSPIDQPVRLLPRPASPGGGAGDNQDREASG